MAWSVIEGLARDERPLRDTHHRIWRPEAMTIAESQHSRVWEQTENYRSPGEPTMSIYKALSGLVEIMEEKGFT